MAFITHFWKNAKFFAAGCILALLLAPPAVAEGIKLLEAHSRQSDDAYFLDTHFRVQLNTVLEDALLNGIPLTFAVEYRITQPRWYWAWRQLRDWFDPTARRSIKLSWHGVSRQYRLSSDNLHQSYGTLDEALQALGVVRDWKVLEKSYITRLPYVERVARYSGELSMRLDTDQLPKPLQVQALTGQDWVLNSTPLPIPLGIIDLEP